MTKCVINLTLTFSSQFSVALVCQGKRTLRNVVAEVGETVNFTCETNAGSPGSSKTMSWFRDINATAGEEMIALYDNGVSLLLWQIMCSKRCWNIAFIRANQSEEIRHPISFTCDITTVDVSRLRPLLNKNYIYCSDVIMGAMVTQITSLTIVYWTVYSDTDQIKHRNPATLAFVKGIYWSPMDYPHKGPGIWKMFPFDDVIMLTLHGLTRTNNECHPGGHQWDLYSGTLSLSKEIGHP